MKLSPTVGSWKSKGPDEDVAVLMSGGVDSSTAAMLLRDVGWNVVGVTMQLPLAGEQARRRHCCGSEAAYVCRDLGVPHFQLDVRQEFRDLVIEPFRRAYLAGRTPSPCVDCNTDVKFGVVWGYLERELGIKRLATGHYARVVATDGSTSLLIASDRSRDQSYFLYGVPLERLPYLLLPLGELTKRRVRKLARDAGLPVARRLDSMDLCFANEGDYRDALACGARTGPILTTSGEVIGSHKGIANYTVGQRRGLGVAAGAPLYVLRIDAVANGITAGTHEDALQREVGAERMNVLAPELYREGAQLAGKIRSQGAASPCSVTLAEQDTVSVTFDEPQFAPAPGQRLVLYEGERVVAGGVIVPSERVR